MTVQDEWKKLCKILDEAEAYERAVGKLNFDLECTCPEEGMDRAGEDMAILGRRIFSLTHSKRYVGLLTALKNDGEGLTDRQRRAVEMLFRENEKEKNLTPAFAFEFHRAETRAYAAWLAAKKASDYSRFAPAFAKMIDLTQKAVALRDKKYPTPYDALLDDYEPGGSVAQLDLFFAALKRRVLPLVKRIAEEGRPIRTDFLTRPVPIEKQETFSRAILDAEGLRRSSLVLATTEHPFTDHYGPKDVRVTTHYYENNFVSNIFTTLHEGGHALFMQNEPEEYYPDHVADNMTSAMHETVSRFYENLIGRSRAFIRYLYPLFKKIGGKTFSDVSEEELYLAVNASTPGLNRCESDELTYPIHVLIRYELERAFINGEIKVGEIPAAWNAKYKEYLGVTVKNDAEGCLQDVHWTGMYGYFPSYALGNAYGAQILRTMEKEFDVFAAVGRGDLHRVGDWLTERVFSIASLCDPDEWIRRITGEPLNVDYYLDYLEAKFKSVYSLV
ncbi:MAG: carboxypeptidase M32 [Clostridia bacterium]|nr:carboxypeptidase M32 [Clostridia bacterium]